MSRMRRACVRDRSTLAGRADSEHELQQAAQHQKAKRPEQEQLFGDQRTGAEPNAGSVTPLPRTALGTDTVAVDIAAHR